jgi:hypothetical protein
MEIHIIQVGQKGLALVRKWYGASLGGTLCNTSKM